MLFAVSFAIAAVFAVSSPPVSDDFQSVNKVLGDVSFVEKFGRAPTADDDEDLRITTHLEYVERKLLARSLAGWSPDQIVARAQTMSDLRTYIERGEFPRNTYLSGRRPVFIDDSGNICAVGYLIEASAGRDVAEAINVDYQFASIDQIEAPALQEWLGEAGISEREAAMIQPGYAEVTVLDPQPIGQITAVPGSAGPTLASQQLSFSVLIIDTFWNEPVAGYPSQDIFLVDQAGTLMPCQGGTTADAATNAEGIAQFSQSLSAGGIGQDVRVYAGGVPSGVLPSLIIVSPDLDGSRQVGLEDVGEFAAKFASSTVDYEIDFDANGSEDLADVGLMASYMGADCN